MEKEVVGENNELRMIPKEKQKFRLQIPYNLRFPLIWTTFFAVLGIIIQSINAGRFIFKDFFLINYVNWFKSFGSFSDLTTYGAEIDVVLAILRHWYYFFYTGGLLSLIWAFIHWFINFEFVFKKKEPVIIQSEQEEQKQIFLERQKLAEKYEEKLNLSNSSEIIEAWLQQGYQFLTEQKIEEAELIYNEIKREYDSKKDPTGTLHARIILFYEEILRNKQNY